MNRDNWCKPIEKELVLEGFTVTRPNLRTHKVPVAKIGFITSEDDKFITYANSLMHMVGIYRNINNMLIKISSDNKAKIYVDNFPIVTNVILNTDKSLGTVVFENEIEDITSVHFADAFEDVSPVDGDKVICLLRHKFRFLLFWDLSGSSKKEKIAEVLGSLLTKLSFYNFANFFEKKNVTTLVSHGWYPFSGLKENELNYIIEKRGKPAKTWLEGLLTEKRLKIMFDKWLKKPVFKSKEKILKSGLDNFIRRDYVASIKTLISEIEGLLDVAHQFDTSKSLKFKDKDICEYLKDKTSNQIFHRLNSLEFIEYMSHSIYKKGITKITTKKFGTRHSVAHGRAESEAYSLERNIQIILTINQLFYYL